MEVDSFPERISVLQAELKKCGNEIMTHISGLYSDNSCGTMDLKNGPRNTIKLLQHNVVDCLQIAQERSDVRNSYAPDVENCRSLIEIISKVSDIATKISLAEEAVGGSHLLLACDHISAIKEMLTQIPAPNTEIGTGEVCSVLRKEARLLRSRLLARIKRLLGSCIVCECGVLTVTKKLKGMLRGCSEDSLLESPIELSDIWTALISLGSAVESVDEIVDTIFQAIIFPLWKEKRAQAPSLYSNEERSEIRFDNIVKEHSLAAPSVRGETKLGPHGISGSSACRMAFPQLLEQVTQVLVFMRSEVLCENAEVIQIMSAKLSSSPKSLLMHPLCEAMVGLMPKNEADLIQFQKSIEKPCIEFENKLCALGLFDVTATNGGKKQQSLTDLVSDLSVTYASMRRKEILSRGRDLLLSDYHNTMLAAGDAMEDDPSSAGDIGDPTAVLEQSGCFSLQALQFESCQVSLASCRILKLIHEVMKQACSSSPAVSAIMFLSARDCLELFMAIVPVRFDQMLETVPRMAAVLYNDSCYIAHNCTLITHTYKDDLGKIDPSLQSCSGFIDFIPKFRAMGEACLSKHLEEQCATLTLLVARINLRTDGLESTAGTNRRGYTPGISNVGRILLEGLRSQMKDTAAGPSGGRSEDAPLSASSAPYSNDEEAANQVVRHLERLKGQWQGVLQEAVYDRVVGYLLETVLRLAMQPILEADCVTECAGVDIGRIFRTLQRSRTAFSTTGQDDEALGKIVASWFKFCALSDLLGYSLGEVAEGLSRRKFASFSGTEMSNMIKALFQDSPRRKGILNSILEMSS